MMAWPIPPLTAGIFPANTDSPVTLNYSSVIGRTYVLLTAKTSATGDVTGVQDDAGNTWTRVEYAPKSGTVGRRIDAWLCTPTSAFSQVQIVHPGGLTYGTLLEIAGTTGVVNDAAAEVRSSSTAPSRVEITPTEDDCLVIAAVMANNNKAEDITAPSGWTYLDTHPDGPQIVYRTDVQANTSVGVDWVFAAAWGSGHVIVALEAATGGPGLSVVSVWDGAVELPAYVEGVWDGTQIVPASLDGVI